MLRFSQVKFIVALLAISFLLFAAFPVSAAPLVPLAPLVQCDDDCTLCDLFRLMQNIISFLIRISFALAGLMIAFGGIMILTAAGNPGQIEQGKKAMTGAVIGIVIVLVSWLVINTLIVTVSDMAVTGADQPSGFLWPWDKINCT